MTQTKYGPPVAGWFDGQQVTQEMQLLRCAAGAQHAQTPRRAAHGLRNAVTTAHQGRLCMVGVRGMGEVRRPSLWS